MNKGEFSCWSDCFEQGQNFNLNAHIYNNYLNICYQYYCCVTGSFKVRGIVNQFANIPSEIINRKKNLVSMSAGNYGKAFAFATERQNLPATLCMPESAPISRAKLIEVCKEK